MLPRDQPKKLHKLHLNGFTLQLEVLKETYLVTIIKLKENICSYISTNLYTNLTVDTLVIGFLIDW